MDSDGELDEGTEPVSLPFSWAGFVCEVFRFAARTAAALAELLGEMSNTAAYAHNKFVDDYRRRDDGERFAREVMAGIEQL